MRFLKRFMSLMLIPFMLAGCGGDTAEETTAESIVEIEATPSLLGYTYQNKIEGSAADPFILEYRGTYYLYSTGGTKFTVRTSKDLVNWTKQSDPVLKLSDTSWAVKNGWAPEVYEYNGKFYFIFSAQGENGIHSIDIAVCDTPNGRFKPLFKQPFFSPEYSVIDASLFFDDDGRVYLYYSKDNSTNYVDGKRTSQTFGVELEKDLSGMIGEHVLISTPYQDWELKSGSVVWNEGPVVFKDNGTYYLLYSANYYQSEHYSVGYATSDSPLKMFEKNEKACILRGNGTTVTGPGHCNILRSPDNSEIYVVYHVHTVPPNTNNGRSLAIDRLIINDDKTLAVDGPSESRRLLPSGVNGFYHLHDGFTFAGDGEKAEFPSKSKIENLFNGIAKATFDGVYSLGEGGTVSIKFDTPTELYAMWVYSSAYYDYIPGSVDVLVNGKYSFSGLEYTQVKYTQSECPITVDLSSLPEGTLVEDIKITVHTAEGLEYAALSEISFVTR